MLTTCPRCAHQYPSHHITTPTSNLAHHHHPASPCCSGPPMATTIASHHYVNQPPPTPRTYVNQMPPPPPRDKSSSFSKPSPSAGGPAGISVSLHLPPSGTTTVSITTCDAPHPSLTVTAFTNPDHRALAGMTGGGIIHGNSVILQESSPDENEKFGHPQPSPSVPLTFVLPTPPTVLTFPWGQWSQPWVSIPAQSETDLIRIAATLKALRLSGWYYEGLSWQDSSDLLRETPPGTFLVRDSSDPRFLFSLSVQTDRGPTSVRLHYVCGQFRLDAERRLAPIMPMFDCVVKLVEHYILATRESGYTKEVMLKKDQVWVDARGHMYSHILLTSPLYKASRLPSLQHLARLTINDQIMRRSTQGVRNLPLPETLKAYLKEYPHAH